MGVDGETGEGDNVLGASSANGTVMAWNCYCFLCDTFIQWTGVQKQAEKYISANSIQAVFLVVVIITLQCSSVPITEIDSRSPGTKCLSSYPGYLASFPGPATNRLWATCGTSGAAGYPGGFWLHKHRWGNRGSHEGRKQLEVVCTEEQLTWYTITTSLPSRFSFRRWEPLLEMSWTALLEKVWWWPIAPSWDRWRESHIW